MKLFGKKTDDMPANELFKKAGEAINARKFDDAVKFLSSLLAKHPEHLDGRVLLADCYMLLKKYNEAYAQCDYILKTEPNHAAAHFIYGLTLIQDSRHDEGMERLKRATELAPENEHFRNGYYAMKYDARRLDITGLGAKYMQHMGDMVAIQITELLTEVAEKCVKEDKAVSVAQVCIEGGQRPEQLPMFLKMVSENTGIKWKTIKIGQSDFMIFERP